jgi:hypothetical protein
VYLAAPCFKLAQNNELPTYINNKEDNKPAKYADFLFNAPANGSAFFRFLIVRRHLICSSDATKLGERVEFYCNGKELRSAPRQKLRTCIGAACSMHCAFISHKFLARNHLLASLLLSAGRRDAAVQVSRLRAEKKRVVLCTSYSTPVLLPDRRCAGRTGGRRATIQVHNGVTLYDGTPMTREYFFSAP